MEKFVNSVSTLFEEHPTNFGGQVYRLGELFAGAGGLALGAHKAKLDGNRFRHIWINDMDNDACKTFKHNFSIDKKGIYCCDVRELDFTSMPSIDGLAFGFPCNDFSVVGDRHGISGKYGELYLWGVSALKTLKPLFFVAENVSGLSSSNDSKDFDIILNALADAGYDIFPYTYHFEKYGVPQNRRRIIIVGFRKDLNISNFQHPAPQKNRLMTSKEALKDIKSDAFNHEFTKQSNRVVERLKHIKPGENAFTINLPEHLRLNMKSGAKISQIYRRLKPDAPSYTVTGSGGGGTHLYHWEENRALTNRERARLQSFPDNFEFLGGKESVRKQIGMAVPPEGARIVFNAILKTLIEHQIETQC